MNFLEVDTGYKTPCHIPLKLDGTPLGVCRDGYSRCVKKDGRSNYLYKRMYEEVNGPVPKGHTIDHLCRHKACCNLEHLEAGRHALNIQRSSLAKLTIEQVIQIRALWAGGVRNGVIAKKFGISPSHISGICHHRFWKEPEEEINIARQAGACAES